MSTGNLDRAEESEEQLRAEPTISSEPSKNSQLGPITSLRGGDYDVRLDFFEGPLDLLLHLVQQKEVAVKDVDMSDVANQYLEIVSSKQTAELDLDLASEYLVIAATLIAIKSQRLLPDNKPEELDPLLTETDPEILEELRQRLLAYELVKKQAKNLSTSPQLGVNTFTRRHKLALEEEKQTEFEINSDGNELAFLFSGLLNRIGEKLKTYKIHLEPVSVIETMMKTLDNLTLKKKSSFSGLLKFFSSERKTPAKNISCSNYNALAGSRGIVISSFISVLELVKRGLISVRQDSREGEIHLELKMLDAEENDASEKIKNLDDTDLD